MLEDIRRTQRMIDDLTRSHAIEQVMRDADRIQQLIRPPTIERLMRDMNRFRALQEQVAKPIQIEAIDRIRSQLTSAIDAARTTRDHLRDATERIASDAERIRQMFESPGGALRSSMLVFEQLAPPAGVLGASSTLAAAMVSFRQATDLSTFDSLREFLDHLDRGVAEAIDKAPEDPNLRLSWYGHLIAVLFFILSTAHSQYLHHLSMEASAEFESRVMQQFALLNDRLDELQPAEPTQALPHFYLVDRQGALTARPRQKSTVLRWLQPGELVWIRERKGKWFRIHYVDSVDGSIHEGWVKKKYLKH